MATGWLLTWFSLVLGLYPLACAWGTVTILVVDIRAMRVGFGTIWSVVLYPLACARGTVDSGPGPRAGVQFGDLYEVFLFDVTLVREKIHRP